MAAGCTHIPPAELQATATDYNAVLQRTSAEQLLLNLVRLRYHEPSFFMQPSAVSAQLRRTVELTAQAGINDARVTCLEQHSGDRRPHRRRRPHANL